MEPGQMRYDAGSLGQKRALASVNPFVHYTFVKTLKGKSSDHESPCDPEHLQCSIPFSTGFYADDDGHLRRFEPVNVEMQYVDAPSLKKHLHTSPVSPEEAIDLLGGMLHEVERIHEIGIIHRRVTSSTIRVGVHGLRLL